MDGTIDYSRYPNQDLLQVLGSIRPEKAPLNFARLKNELESRGYVLSQTTTGGYVARLAERAPGAIEATDASACFTVRLNLNSSPFAWYEPAWNDFRLVGTGTVEVLDSQVRIVARRFTLIGIPLKRRVELDRRYVSNVEQMRNVVAFEYLEPQSDCKRLSLHFSDQVTAERFCSLLNVEPTSGFVPKLSRHLEFERALHSQAPHAPVTWALIAFNVVMFLVAVIRGADVFGTSGELYVTLGSNFGPYTSDGEWWRAFTSMFLHFGLLHLTFNLWALLSIGPTVERFVGSVPYLLLYVTSGACGAFASVVWNPAVNSAGASGAILGLCGALLAVLSRANHPIPRTVRQPLLLSMTIFTCYALAAGMLSDHVDNAAHIGGLSAGAVVGLILSRPIETGVERLLPADIKFAAALTLAVCALLIGALAAKYSGRSLTGDALFWHTQHWFVRNEVIALQRREALWEQAKAGSISDAAFADQLENSILRFWREAESRFAAVNLSKESAARPDLEFFIIFSRTRRNAFELCTKSARQHSTVLADQCTSELNRGDRLVEDRQRELADR